VAYKRFLLVVILLATISCERGRAPWPENVQKALEQAGAHKGELEKVLRHYQNPQDSLKLKAAYYLIANMPDHGYLIYALYDTSGKEVDFDVLQYPNYKEMAKAWDSIAAIRGALDFKRQKFIADIQTVSAEFLIENIDLAFKAWREKPWAAHLDFDQFCRYVLPYRGSNEPLQNWRRYFYEHSRWVDSVFTRETDPAPVAAAINDSLKSWFRFDDRFYRHPTDQGLNDMLNNQMGRCEDMANLAIYAMRANGLAVTSDYTPYWADAANNHAWNALIIKGGKAIPFMGGLSNPGAYSLPNRIAKVYRKTYEYQPGNLVFRLGDKKKIPRWLSGKSYTDVTRAYVPVSDVRLKLEAPPDSVEYAYLCVFNTGEWKAIHWGVIISDSVRFTDMGRDLVYLPAYYLHGKLVPAGPAIILTAKGRVRALRPDLHARQTVTLTSTTRRTTREATDTNRRSFLKPDRNYELFYWDGEWKSLGKKKTSRGKALYFKNVPENALLWLVEQDSKKYERIFVYDQKQIWY